MSERDFTKPEASDATLVEQTRRGDQRAFAELWRRHYRSGARVARQFTSSLDADDLVSEAFTRIYKRVLAGGGPEGAFRPYLYTTIRNLASTWGAASRDVQVDDIADFHDPTTLEDPAANALDRTLTARAFRSLPDRWQAVLWYTEVEGLDPHEVAPLLGMTANGVAALSYRAREGLRKAWLQAHISDATAAGECQWTVARIGDNARHSLTPRDAERMSFHLTHCSRCAIISEEVDEVGSRLAFVLLPIVLGGVAGGALLATLSASVTPAAAATASAAIPAVPQAIGAGTAALGFTAAATVAGPAALVGSLAIVAVLGGGVVAVLPSVAADDTTDSTAAGAPLDPTAAGAPGDQGSAATPGAGTPTNTPAGSTTGALPADDPANIPGGVVGGVIADVPDIVGSVVDTITGDAPPEGHTAPGGVVGADVSLALSGTGTPGAHLSLQAAGQVYATTTVDANGNFTLAATTIPGGLSSLELVQVVDRGYLGGLVGGGLLGGVLGTVDELINTLIKPVVLTSNDSSISVSIVS